MNRAWHITSIRVALCIPVCLVVSGCGKHLFPQDEPWRVPESDLRAIESTDLQESAEALAPSVEEGMEGTMAAYAAALSRTLK